MRTANVLILEDDLQTLSSLLQGLAELEGEGLDIGVTVLSNYKDVEELINPAEAKKYDLILLDRDCKLAGSFHVLDIKRIGASKIISISSIPEYNTQAKERGVERIVWKDYEDLAGFTKQVMEHVRELLNG